MAGEWIKVSTNIHSKPEVRKLSRLISADIDVTVGLLMRFWVWADQVTVDGVVDGVVEADVDDIVGRPGLCTGLITVGWVEKMPNGDGIRLINFDRHNGESAKKRALKNARQARWRANPVVGKASTETSTRVEKRREDIKPPNPLLENRSSKPPTTPSIQKAQAQIAEQASWQASPMPEALMKKKVAH